METTKKRPTIAIDVDGVLRNNLGIMVDLYNRVCRTSMKPEDVKDFLTEISFPLIPDILGIKSSEYFFNMRAKEVFLDAPAYPNVKVPKGLFNCLKMFQNIFAHPRSNCQRHFCFAK